MATQEQKELQIVWHQVSIIERFSSVLYPLDLLELLKQLPAIGYIVPDLVLRGTPEVGKPIATKGDIDLVINQDNKTIGVSCRSSEKAIEAFQELRQFYLEHLDLSPNLATQYVEFNGNGWLKSKRNPVETLSQFWSKYEPLRELGKVLGQDVINFGLQLAPPKDPIDPDWFHIYIDPLITASSSRYRIRWVWRGHNLKEVLEKHTKVNELLKGLISKIEGS